MLSAVRRKEIAKSFLFAAIVLWLASVLLSFTYYGDHVSVKFEEGLIALYSCDDLTLLHNWMHNGYVPPWYGHGAGGDVYAYLGGDKYEWYGPSLAGWMMATAIRSHDWQWIRRIVGFHLPAIQWNLPERDVVMPTIVLPFWVCVATAGAILYLTTNARAGGHCRHCSYNLTGNVSGVCSECGVLIDERSNPMRAVQKNIRVPPDPSNQSLD